MGYLLTDALTLRAVDYKDHDRLLMLLTPDHGVVDAIARGCRRQNSPLLAAGSVFISGEFALFERGGRYSVQSCHVHDAFYPLRADLDALENAAYCARWCAFAAQPNQSAPDLHRLILSALAFFAYGEARPGRVTAVFLAHLCALLGVAPIAERCAACGGALAGLVRWDPASGGAVCASCRTGRPLPEATPGALSAVRACLRTPSRDITALDAPDEDVRQARALLRFHLEALLGVPPDRPLK